MPGTLSRRPQTFPCLPRLFLLQPVFLAGSLCLVKLLTGYYLLLTLPAFTSPLQTLPYMPVFA